MEQTRLWKCRPDGQPVETKSRFHRLPTGLGKERKKPRSFPQFHSHDDEFLFLKVMK
jgi:hypothetical protein